MTKTIYTRIINKKITSVELKSVLGRELYICNNGNWTDVLNEFSFSYTPEQFCQYIADYEAWAELNNVYVEILEGKAKHREIIMNKADKVKQKLIKEVVIPSLIGVLIALLFLLAVVKPTGASEDSTRPMTGTVYFVSGRSVSIVSPDKRTWSYKGKGFSVGDTVSCVVSNNGTSKTVDDYIKSAVVSEGQPIEIEAAEEGALVHFASETWYLERRY